MDGVSDKESWVDEYWPTDDYDPSEHNLLDLPYDHYISLYHSGGEEEEDPKNYQPSDRSKKVKCNLYTKMKSSKPTNIPGANFSTEELLDYFDIAKDVETELRELAGEGEQNWNTYLNRLYREFNPV
jgi:hypothetical protein